ncbi:MAG: hypothetical protein R3F30_11940 [Planctomycetota bacterium]
MGALVLALVAVAQSGALGSPLQFDDAHAVADNPAIRSLGNLVDFFTDPSCFSTTGRMYRPLVLTTLAVEHAVGGGAPLVYKLGNLAWHLATCALLLACLPSLLARAGAAPRAGRLGAAVAVLLFGLHPVHVESMALVSARSELLMAFGLCLALHGWLAAAGRPGVQAAWLAVGTLVACLAKETGVFVPIVVLLAEVLLPDRRHPTPPRVALAARAAPALALVLGYLSLRHLAFALTTVPTHSLAVTVSDPWSGGGRSLADQWQGMGWFLPRAWALVLAPLDLSVDHTVFWARSPLSPAVLAGWATVLVPVALALAWRRRVPLAAFALLTAVGVSLPWILVPLNQPLAEHRLYVPVLCAAVPLGALLGRGLLAARPVPARVAVVGLALLLGVGSLARGRLWHDEAALWADTLESYPSSFRARNGLGQAFVAEGRLDDALREFEACVDLYPLYLPGVQNLCEVRVRLLDRERDPAFHDETVRLCEDHAEWHWKDPFVRLLAARARAGRYGLTHDPEDLRAAVAWAWSPHAMLAPKLLVHRTAASFLRHADEPGALLEALALHEAWDERGLTVRDPEALREYLAERGALYLEADMPEAAVGLGAELHAQDPTTPAGMLLMAGAARLRGDRAGYERLRTLLGRAYGLGEDAIPGPPAASSSPNR